MQHYQLFDFFTSSLPGQILVVGVVIVAVVVFLTLLYSTTAWDFLIWLLGSAGDLE